MLTHESNQLGEYAPETVMKIAFRNEDVLYYPHEVSTTMSLAEQPSDTASISAEAG